MSSLITVPTLTSLDVFITHRSITRALLKVMHGLFVPSDCSQNIIRILHVFVDFSKAFDLIERNILLNKFVSSGVPEHVSVLDLLNDRKQFGTRNPHAIVSIKPRDAAQPQSVRRRRIVRR